jgi:hypothetical protein
MLASWLSVLTAGEAASATSAAASSAASGLATSLFVVLSDLLEAIILLLLNSGLGNEWLTILITEGSWRAVLMLSLFVLLLFTCTNEGGAIFLSRRLGFVDDDLLLKFLLKFGKVLVSLSIVVVLFAQQTLKGSGELGPLLGSISLLLLNRGSGPSLLVFVEAIELVLSPCAFSGCAHLTNGTTNGSLRELLLLSFGVAKLWEVSFSSHILSLLEGRPSLVKGDAVLLELI